MQYRQFGNTDLRVSEIGFGTWAIGGAAFVGNLAIGWGPSDDAVSLNAIHAALDAGINFLTRLIFMDWAMRRSYSVNHWATGQM
jgi:aryl-alcohol dehydrogenase-like predicted oxidoreductase